eukprot:CAMPEP_0118820280 /NCGR_PEP_ID=MMETSP1162-20130426/7591_1 /TAXON_ID=33656 /ORGANISM="Phaeocystis Sp, Strain CCMP2710" /LENGTH=94 /DNA_ID=CAMNT_0006750651 /DNA_START=267 /DNA_END=551 /DNA_ORIENTATION=+
MKAGGALSMPPSAPVRAISASKSAEPLLVLSTSLLRPGLSVWYSSFHPAMATGADTERTRSDTAERGASAVGENAELAATSSASIVSTPPSIGA